MRDLNDYNENEERLTKVNDRITMIEKVGGQSFGTDAFLLSAYASPARAGMGAVDLGSGCGICSLLLADHDKADHVYAVEIQTYLASTAERNVKLNGLEEKVSVICTDLRMINKRSFEHPIDTVIANPPYFKKSAGKNCPDPIRNASRFEINGGIADFCSAASEIMRPGAKFYCVIRPERLSELISSLRACALELRKMTPVCHTVKSAPSVLLCCAERTPSSVVNVTRALFLRDSDGNMTEDAQKIYDNCDFGDFFNE